jgi:hypothetical protein
VGGEEFNHAKNTNFLSKYILVREGSCQDGGEFFAVVYVVQFGTADQGDPAFHEVPVKIAVGIGGAVGGDQNVRVFKIRGCRKP